MRKVLAGGALVAASLGVASGVHIFEKGLENNHQSDRLSGNIAAVSARNQFETANNAEFYAEQGRIDQLNGVIIASAGAGALILTGVAIKKSAIQN